MEKKKLPTKCCKKNSGLKKYSNIRDMMNKQSQIQSTYTEVMYRL